MKKFNLNYNILIHITEYGWQHLRQTVGQDYIDACITYHKEIVDGKEYYKLQAHEVITLFGTATFAFKPCPIETNILIPDQT